MDLIFAETANRNQCGCQVVVNGLAMQCTFSSSKTVELPAGLQYFDGTLSRIENKPSSILSICKNHEGRLRVAFDEFLNKA